jgi:hypothetical protein
MLTQLTTSSCTAVRTGPQRMMISGKNNLCAFNDYGQLFNFVFKKNGVIVLG